MGGFGINDKASEGRARKEAQKNAKKKEVEMKMREKEDEKWELGVKKKSNKKVQDEIKRAEKLHAKKEREKLEVAESIELSKYKKPSSDRCSIKITKDSNIADNLGIKYSGGSNIAHQSNSSDLEVLSRTSSIQNSFDINNWDSKEISEYSAENIDDAIMLLKNTSGDVRAGKLERHPERRVKASFAIFKEREMAILRSENPGLRISQLNEKLYKMWEKSPDNPFNQAFISHRATKKEELEFAEADVESRLDRLKIMSPR